MALTMMQFVALTAGIDTVIALITWLILRRHARQVLRVSPAVQYFSLYLLFSAGFLALTAIAMGILTGTSQALTVLGSDLLLWVSLVLFILFVAVGRSTIGRATAVILLLTCALVGTLYQIALLAGLSLAYGSITTYILTNMAPLLMYAVWVPSAVVFFITAAKNSDRIIRIRSLMLGLGLLLITYSWASRLGIFPSGSTVLPVIISSLTGFSLLLGGVTFRNQQ